MSNKPVNSDAPKFNRDTRERIAIAKYYGLDGNEWTQEEIGEYLNVSERRVREYVSETEFAEDMERMLAQRQATTRLELLEDLRAKLDSLKDVEEQLKQEVEAVPSRYRIEDAEAKIDPSEYDGLEEPVDIDQNVSVKVPVPDAFAEVPNIEELTDVWRERRLVQEQIEDLMGLEEPEELKTQQEKTVDIKHWDMSGEGTSLPDQEVIEIESDMADTDSE